MNPYLNPETINLLGGSRETTSQTSEPTIEPQHKQTRWGRFKSGARKVFGAIRQVLDYTKETIVPIITAVTGVLNAWRCFKNCKAKMCEA